jgi:hypothetical protein
MVGERIEIFCVLTREKMDRPESKNWTTGTPSLPNLPGRKLIIAGDIG